MGVVEFFEQSTGKWFSQCTSHHLIRNQTQSSQANLVIEALTQDDDRVASLCRHPSLKATPFLYGLQATAEVTDLLVNKKQHQAIVLVVLAVPDQVNQGLFLRTNGGTSQVVRGHYSLGINGALTLTMTDGTGTATERQWFASENLRLRTISVQQGGTFETAAFYSEIRMGGTKSSKG